MKVVGCIYPPLFSRLDDLGPVYCADLVDELVAGGDCTLLDAAATCRAEADRLIRACITLSAAAWANVRAGYQRDAMQFEALAQRLEDQSQYETTEDEEELPIAAE